MYRIVISSLFFFLIFTNLSLSQEKIAFVDIDKIVFNSELGKKVEKNFNDEFNKENDKFLLLEKNLKEKENNILKQKNILSEEELTKKTRELRIEINDFQKKRISFTEKFRLSKVKQTNELLKKLNPILFKYAENNSISLILRKSDIVLGKSTLDITDDIMEIFNKNVKSLN
ncbi:outer membrane protein [alpha proteobacterium HIMB5]|nr:outer membrane protein [alpha proteobacterium HIMB5]